MTRPLRNSAKRSVPSNKAAQTRGQDQDSLAQPAQLKAMTTGTTEANLAMTMKPAASRSIKAVAIYEIVKGIAALLAAMALWLWHKDLDSWLSGAVALWRDHFGRLLITQVDSLVANAILASQNWRLFLLGILGYASLRFIEAYGLWTDRTWAYWFSVLGYGVFIPLELYYLIVSPIDWFKILIFILNIVIVIVVYRNMKRKGLI